MWHPVRPYRGRINLSGRISEEKIEEVLQASALAEKFKLCPDTQEAFVSFCIMFTTQMMLKTFDDQSTSIDEGPVNAST
jgi:hypothetical protein